MFLPKLPFLEQRIHQMSFNLKRKAIFQKPQLAYMLIANFPEDLGEKQI